MSKLVLNDINSGYASATAYNTNNTLIETALENTLSRDGTTPNTMGVDLDMNNHALLNVSGLTLNGVSVVPTGTTTVNANGMIYTPAGTGAIATTVQAKLRETVSIFDFLTATEIADIQAFNYNATTQVNVTAAFNTALAATGTLYIPPGGYVISSTINVGSNKTIIGPMGGSKAWQGNATLKFTGASGSLFNLNSTGYGGVFLGHFRIIGGHGTAGSFAITSIQPQCVFENILIDDYNGGGISLVDTTPGAWDTQLRGVKYQATTTPNSFIGFSINIIGGNGLTIKNCTATYGAIGIDIIQGEGILIDGFNGTSQNATYSTLSNVDGQAAIRLSGADSKFAISIKNCYCENNTYFVYAEKVQSLSIEDCFWDDVGIGNSSAGIYLKDANVTNITIKNNWLQNRTLNCSCINVAGAAEDVLIINNTLTASGGGTAAAIINTTSTTVRTFLNKIVSGLTTDASNNLQTLVASNSGTFTPVLIARSGGTQPGVGTYTNQLGFYRKIGPVVYFMIYIEWTAHTGSGGDAHISFNDLQTKFPVQNTTGLLPVAEVMPSSVGFTFAGQIAGHVRGDITTNNGVALDNITSGAVVAPIAITAAGLLRVSGFYFTTA